MHKRSPLRSSKYELVPPDNQTAEGWLVQFDATPVVVPSWPLSSQMTLVAVVAYATTAIEESRAYVLTDRDDLLTFAHPSVGDAGQLVLFFTVLRQRVIQHTAGLTVDAWSD